MIWKKRYNDYMTLKNMSYWELKRELEFLYNTDQKEINGHSTPYWIMNFNKELDYRKRREAAIINALPCYRWFNSELNNIKYNIKYKKQ